jgi:predicted small metal-binding protein
MKNMTCKQMGGACDMKISGDSAQEMMNNGAKHLRESTEEGDKKALQMMNDMQRSPEEQRKWQEEFERMFAQLPEN